MPEQVMPDIDALDGALYVSLENSGRVVTGPSFPYSSFYKEKFSGYKLDMKAYQDEPYVPLGLISPLLYIDKIWNRELEIKVHVDNNNYDLVYHDLAIDKLSRDRSINYDVPLVNDDNYKHEYFEIEKRKSYVPKDIILGVHAFPVEEQDFSEIYERLENTDNYQYAYFDEKYYYFIDNSTSNIEDIDREDLTIIQEFTKLKPKVYSPPRLLTDFIGQMEGIDFDVLSYDYMSSPILYTGITPFVQVGTRINRVIYPKTTMQTRGALTRRFCL